MLILAFDTTSEHGGVAIYRGQDCRASTLNQGPANYYSVTLFEMLDRMLGQAKVALRDIELFAVANGPGSFTGIRVGLAAAKAWAEAFRRPVKAVSVLEAIVEEARPEGDWAVPILDARRGEFFVGLFRRLRQDSKDRFVADGQGMVLKPSDLGSFLEDRALGGRAGATVTCLVREQDPVAQALCKSLSTDLRWQSVPGSLLGAVARLAVQACQEGRLQTPAELDAYYIRRPDAELNWRT